MSTSALSRWSRLHRSMRGLALGTVAAVGLSACNTSVEDTAKDATYAASSAVSDMTSATTSSKDAAASEGTWPRTVTVENGDITIPAKPKRIVSTSVTLTGSLLALDAPVVASGAGRPDSPFADSHGFFKQWSNIAEERGVRPLYTKEPDVEAILAEQPDLIVVSKIGRDSAAEVIDQFAGIPTVVVDYSDKTWEELTTQLGEITGLEKEARAKLDEFDKLVADTASQLTLPQQPVNTISYLSDGRGANVFTDESAQNSLLASLGFDIAPIPDEVKGNEDQGKRHDIVKVSTENLSVAINGETLLLAAAEDDLIGEVTANPALANSAAVRNNRVYALGADTFRLDYFSAVDMVKRVQELFS